MLVCSSVSGKKCVNQAEKLHHTFVLSQVLVPFQEKDIVFAVISSHCYLAWPLFTCDHLHIGDKSLNLNVTAINSIRSWNSQLQIPRIVEGGATLIQLQCSQTWKLFVNSPKHSVVQIPCLVQSGLGFSIGRRSRSSCLVWRHESSLSRDGLTTICNQSHIISNMVVSIKKVSSKTLQKILLSSSACSFLELSVKWNKNI
mmetsp:Transcript_8004/g.14474  ORF Transcript_8004/g.14474 Transcript_8004/m.14474 type:complete len:200 (-) Transcript_8004:1684-2283(-)